MEWTWGCNSLSHLLFGKALGAFGAGGFFLEATRIEFKCCTQYRRFELVNGLTMSLARKTLLIALAMAVPWTAGAADASAAWKPGRASLDHRFGNNGWVDLPLPPGRSTDLGESLTSVTAGPGETYFVVASTARNTTGRIAGGVVEKFNSRGNLVRGFGRGGIIRIPDTQTPVELNLTADGSMLLTSAQLNKKQHLTHWVISRLRANGATDKRFGTDGTIRLRIPDPGNKWSPLVVPLDHGRFGVVGYDGSPSFPNDRLRVFSRDGTADKTFADGGKRDFAFGIDSVTPAPGNKIIVGSGGADVQFVRLGSHGAIDPTWGINGVASSGISQTKRWMPDLDEDMNEIDSGGGSIKARWVNGRLLATFETVIDFDGGTYEYGWAQRFSAQGILDATWGERGRRALGASYNSDESDEGDHSILAYEPLGNGKLFYGEYFNGSWSTENSYNLRVVGASGTKSAKGSKALHMSNFWEHAHAFSPDGRYYFALGDRKKRTVITRVRF